MWPKLWGWVVVIFLCCKVPDKGNLRKEGLILARTRSISEGKWRQALEHIVLAVRNREMSAGAHLAILF